MNSWHETFSVSEFPPTWDGILQQRVPIYRFLPERDRRELRSYYGGSNQAEFFAVATECFFEKPKQLCKRHPGLYAALKQFYKQDPAAWL